MEGGAEDERLTGLHVVHFTRVIALFIQRRAHRQTVTMQLCVLHKFSWAKSISRQRRNVSEAGKQAEGRFSANVFS